LGNHPTSYSKNKNSLILIFSGDQKAFYFRFYSLYNDYTYTDKFKIWHYSH
jgi:hypothetical protein